MARFTIQRTMQRALTPETFRKFYRDFAEQNPKWNEIPPSTGDIYQWDENSVTPIAGRRLRAAGE